MRIIVDFRDAGLVETRAGEFAGDDLAAEPIARLKNGDLAGVPGLLARCQAENRPPGPPPIIAMRNSGSTGSARLNSDPSYFMVIECPRTHDLLIDGFRHLAAQNWPQISRLKQVFDVELIGPQGNGRSIRIDRIARE